MFTGKIVSVRTLKGGGLTAIISIPKSERYRAIDLLDADVSVQAIQEGLPENKAQVLQEIKDIVVQIAEQLSKELSNVSSIPKED